MKIMILVLSLFLVTLCDAQMYKRTNKNIGAFIETGITKSGTSKILSSKGLGYTYGLGITSELWNILYPEVYFSVLNRNFTKGDSSTTIQNNALSEGLVTRFDVFHISTGKSKYFECKSIAVNLLLGGRYTHNFYGDKLKTPASDDYSLLLGLGFVPSKSGDNKNQAAWKTQIEFYYQYDFNKDNSYSINSLTGWRTNVIGIKITLFHFHTYDWLGNGG